MSRLFSQHFNFRTWTRSNSFLGVLSIVANMFAVLPIRLHLIDLLFKYFSSSSSSFSKRREEKIWSRSIAKRNVWRNPRVRSMLFELFFFFFCCILSFTFGDSSRENEKSKPSLTEEGTTNICFSKIVFPLMSFFPSRSQHVLRRVFPQQTGRSPGQSSIRSRAISLHQPNPADLLFFNQCYKTIETDCLLFLFLSFSSLLFSFLFSLSFHSLSSLTSDLLDNSKYIDCFYAD